MKRLKFISKRTLVAFTTLVLGLFCLSCSCYAEQPQTVTLSIQTYNQLNSLLTEQDSQLEMLSSRMKMLRMTSPQLVKELTECQNELSQVKDKLNQSQQSLTNSQELLKNAEKEIYALKLSLNKLENDIKNERSKVKRKSTQKACYAVLGGFFVGYLVGR